MLDRKYKKLQGIIKDNRCVLVAFSGGVDSSLLAKVARDVLGENALAVTINSEIMPRNELKEAKKIAKEIGIKHLIVKIDFMKNRDFTKNSSLRCYYCKKEIMKLLKEIAKERRFNVVLDGSNADDMKEERPGVKALKEEGIISPLVDADFGKDDVRKLARKLNLSNSEKESNTCLATRIPRGERITTDRLRRIDKAEEFIKRFKVRNLRVRDHGDFARIEVSDDSDKSTQIILDNKKLITRKLKSLGYRYVTLNL